MPGAYAHITLANIATEPARLEAAGISVPTIVALKKNLRFVELGAVSPDYPYLARGQSRWADNMHYTNTAALLKEGVRVVRTLPKEQQPKVIAWLFGFAAHMTGDMTIHPIVEAIVGPYATNKGAHRNCEMHQDTYIFFKLKLGDAGVSRHLESGIARCHGPHGRDTIDPGVDATWRSMLKAAYSSEYAKEAPQTDAWHRGFNGVLAVIQKVNSLLPFARHVAIELKLDYPTEDQVDRRAYIDALPTPEGKMTYDALFDRALANVAKVWRGLDSAIATGDMAFFDQLDDWNLDTGKSLQTGNFVFWRNA